MAEECEGKEEDETEEDGPSLCCQTDGLELCSQWLNDIDSRKKLRRVGGSKGDLKEQSHHRHGHGHEAEIHRNPFRRGAAKSSRRNSVACSDEEPEQNNVLRKESDNVWLAGKLLACLVPVPA